MQNKVSAILKDLQKDSHLRILQPLRHQGKYLLHNKKKVLNLASNDYLGVAQDIALQQNFLKQCQLDSTPFSSSSSRSLSGNFAIFEELEEFLSQLYAPKNALLFNSGYHANIGSINALHQIGGVLFLVDSFVHASIFDGLRLAHAKFKRFKHNNMQDLKNLLESSTHQYEHIIIVSEGIFSMDGDYCKIQEIIALKKNYKNVFIYLDEAHSLGVCGEKLLGLSENFLSSIDFIVLAFGKAIGSIGGCVLCDNIFKQYFINKARSFIFSTALPPINIAFTLYIFKNLQNFSKKNKHLQTLSLYLQKKLKENNFDFLGESQIISLMTYTNIKSLEIMHMLLDSQIYAPAIRPPSVPINQARIRFSLHANLSLKDLDLLIEALCK